MLSPLVATYPDNFVYPTTWFKCRDAIRASIPDSNSPLAGAFEAINLRNAGLVAPITDSQPAERQILVKHLDSTFQTPFHEDLVGLCWNVSSDKLMIGRTVLE